MKKLLFIFLIYLLFSCSLFFPPVYGEEIISFSSSGHKRVSHIDNDGQKTFDSQRIIKSILVLRNPNTGLSPSHWGHPGYEDLAYLYDKAVDAIILKALGYQLEAEKILDYFADRLRIPMDEVRMCVDTNEIYGILKLFKPRDSSQKAVKSLVNAFNINSVKPQGEGMLEFVTTPGPMSFVIYAMLAVNPKKYKTEACLLGETLLAMQDNEGGVHDGDRAPDKIHTEPHVDAAAALLMLYQITGDEKWRIAAERGYNWFEHNVYYPEEGIIDQGLWSGSRSTIFATDCYSWTMAGPAGDKIPLNVLKKLTETMLNHGLVKITLSLPDSTIQTVILCDFTDAEESRAKKVRDGFHPMGSVEWTGGVILSLQKNAVRFWNAKDSSTARFYKALAEALFAETIKCFYYQDDLRAWITFYATGQGVEVGPFGSIRKGFSGGWKTPFFYAKTEDGRTIRGGSTVGAWPLLPCLGVNPFILNDQYKSTYNQIPLTEEDEKTARSFLEGVAARRTFQETILPEAPAASTQIVEPRTFNGKMWEAFELASAAKESSHDEEAKKYFEEAILWAKKVINDSAWVKLAKRDNIKKESEVGGIIEYPWGVTYPNHPLHIAIWRYALLNEIGAAMWGLATANFELGNYDEAKYWIGRIIDDVPLHQIASVLKEEQDDITKKPDSIEDKIIQGYWNALVVWETNPAGYERDARMGILYNQVLREKGLPTATPKVVPLHTIPRIQNRPKNEK